MSPEPSAAEQKLNRMPTLLWVGGLAALYFVAAKASLVLAIPPGNATPVWPPSGIALAAVLMLGYRVWPGIWLGATLVNGTTHVSMPIAAGIGLGNTLEAVLEAYLLQRLVGNWRPFHRGWDAFTFGAVAGGFSCSLAATVGVTSLWLGGLLPAASYTINWWTWWLGDLGGIIAVTPFVLTWWERPRDIWDRHQQAEGVALTILMVTSGLLIFGGWLPMHTVRSLPYLVLIFLGWTAFRFGPRETATAITVATGIAVWGTIRGAGPFRSDTLNESLLLLQSFVSLVGVSGLALAGLVEERKRIEASLRAARDQLEIRVQERTVELASTTQALQSEVIERKQAEQALQSGEERFHVLVERVKDYAIYMLDAGGRVVSWNVGAERIKGYRSDEIIGQHFSRFFTPEDIEQGKPQQELAIATAEGSLESEGWRVRKDGSRFWASIVITALRDQAGNLRGFAKVTRDITDRRRAEEALREAHERLHAIIQASPLSILAIDPAGRIMNWNTGAESMFGWSEGETLGRPCPTVPAEWLEDFHGMIARVIQGEVITGLVRKRQRKDGAQIDASLSAAPLRNAAGVATGIIVLLEDITEWRKAEAALALRTRQLEALRTISEEIARKLYLPSLLNLIIRGAVELVGAAGGEIYLWNEATQLLTVGASLGQGDWRGTERQELGRGVIGTVAQRQKGMVVTDYRTSPYALPFMLEHSAVTSMLGEPLLYRDRLVGVIGLDNDGTERIFSDADRELLSLFAVQAAIAIENARLFDEVGSARKRLQALSAKLVDVQEAERRRFGRELHDEIGQALTALSAHLQVWKTADSSKASTERLDEGLAIVDQLLQEVRSIAMDYRPPMLDDLGLVAALRWYAHSQAQRAKLKVQFVAHVPETRLAPTLESTCFRVAQEALTNVIRHARASEVRIELRQNSEAVEMLVNDNGVGFDARAALDGAKEGKSFGLLGMQERAGLAGGYLVVESARGQGTEVRVHLPLTSTPSPTLGEQGAAL